MPAKATKAAMVGAVRTIYDGDTTKILLHFL
jgi:hypothetical protein